MISQIERAMKRSAPDSLNIFESMPKRMTEATAGEKEWKWKHYFSQLPDTIRSGIEMDETALFSVTVDTDADVITQQLQTFLPVYSKICDATACVGGNTMSFAKVFTDVTSIEMDRGRYEMLNNNIKLLGLQNRVHTINRDFLAYRDKMPYFDFIFFDPPWGGENYQEKSNIDMYMSDHSIGDIVSSLRHKCRYVGLKSPQNFNITSFERHIHAERVWHKTFEISRKKGTYWVFTLYEFPDEAYGGVLHMLSPALSPAILSQVRTSALTALQAPSHQESEFITRTLGERLGAPVDALFDLNASIGIQAMSFISSHLAANFVMVSPQTQVLEGNVRVLEASLREKGAQPHFLYAAEHGVLKGALNDVRRILAGTKRSCAYLDCYCELSAEQLRSRHLGAVAVDGQPLEVWLQQFAENALWTQHSTLLVLRLPEGLCARVQEALAFFPTEKVEFRQEAAGSSLNDAHASALLFVTPHYPAYAEHLQLATLWKAQPPCLVRKQLTSIFSAVLSDREATVTSLYHTILQSPPKDDRTIWSLAHASYLASFQLSAGSAGSASSTSSTIEPGTAVKVDRSIVRVYANKMKYVDAVVPRGFRPQRILCLGGVDAHVCHDLAKMYELRRDAVLLFGEGDRRREEKRPDYAFLPYPAKAPEEDWAAYRDRVKDALRARLGEEEVDMVVACCPHEIPFFGSLLAVVLSRLATDGVLVINDHHVVSEAEHVLLDLVHDFHRYVTCCHVETVLDREALARDEAIDEDDKCGYLTNAAWEERLGVYGLKRFANERNKALWNASDPTNLLKSFWGCFTYMGMKN